MATAIGAALYIYRDDAIYAQWQNFYQETINGFVFMPFVASEIAVNRSADEGGVTVEVPATERHIQLVEDAITNEYLCQITFLEMNPTSISELVNFDNATIVAQFVGEVVSMSTDLVTMSIEVGTAMDAISGDIPGRKITTSLVGRLPSL